MRYVLLTLVIVSAALGPARADGQAHTALGDIPRTYSHYMNAREAALCRANAAVGGLAGYFFNPASASEVTGVEGCATMRYNMTSREYLPDTDDYLNSSEDGSLFSQAVAVKRSGSLVFGFGYSCPSYRSLELSGKQYVDGPLVEYDAEFTGGLRFFEAVAAARIGSKGQGGVGITAGVVNMNEEAKERVPGESLDSAEISGMAASVAIGLVFDATEQLTFGGGYRWGSSINVDGEWYKQSKEGESKTQPVAVLGVRYRPVEHVAVYCSYVREGWDQARSTLAAHMEEDDEEDGGLDWDLFDEPIQTAALGVEFALMEGKLTVRAGGSKTLATDITNAIVPEFAVGLGGAMKLEQYSLEAAVVREQFREGGESGQVVTYGVYATVGYEF